MYVCVYICIHASAYCIYCISRKPSKRVRSASLAFMNSRSLRVTARNVSNKIIHKISAVICRLLTRPRSECFESSTGERPSSVNCRLRLGSAGLVLGDSPVDPLVDSLSPVGGGCCSSNQQRWQCALHEANPLDERAASPLQRSVPLLVALEHLSPVARVTALGSARGIVEICTCCGSHGWGARA